MHVIKLSSKAASTQEHKWRGNEAYNPVAGLGETARESVDAVGDVRPGPRDGRRRSNLCIPTPTRHTDNQTTNQTQNREHKLSPPLPFGPRT
jgi:hypothetical protein